MRVALVMMLGILLAPLSAVPNLAPTIGAGGSDERQSGSLALGGIQLSLGMSQEEAIRRLGLVYDVRHQESQPGTWTVFRRKDKPPYELMGAIDFRDGRLTGISKIWGPFLGDESANALAHALHTAVRSVAGGSSATCIVSVEAERVIATTVIKCGARTLRVGFALDRSAVPSVIEVMSLR